MIFCYFPHTGYFIWNNINRKGSINKKLINISIRLIIRDSMKRYNYDDYDEFDDEEDEEEENKKDKKSKSKKVHKTKKVTKKSRGRRPKKKVVYKNSDNNTHSGFFSFILFLIIVVLLGVIAYLIYVNYYEKDESGESKAVTSDNNESKEMCEANTTKYTLSSGLNKCSDSAEFKLNVRGTDLSFDILRTSDDNLPYIINTIYYDGNPVSNTLLTSTKVSNDWSIKTDGKVIYLLITNPESNILTVIDNGKVIYTDNSNTEYKLSMPVTYTKYTTLGLNDIDTCENYEANNELDAELWTKGKLVYENGTITDEVTNTVTAKEVCK